MKKRNAKPEESLQPRSADDYDKSASSAGSMNPAAAEALAVAKDILYLIEHKVPDEAKEVIAPEFFKDVAKTSRDMYRRIRHFGSASDKQLNYLKNMQRAVQKWLRDDEDEDEDF